MGWRIISPGRWALFYDHPKKPGARWEKKDAGVFAPVYNKTGPQMTQMELASQSQELPFGPRELLLSAVMGQPWSLVNKKNFRIRTYRIGATRVICSARDEFRERLYDQFDIDSGVLINKTQKNLAMYRFAYGTDYDSVMNMIIDYELTESESEYNSD